MKTYGAEYASAADKLSKRIYAYMQKGDTIAQAYQKAAKEIGFAALNKEAVEDAVYEAALKGYGINAPPVFAGVEGEKALRHKLMDVSWSKDGMSLSTRLHGLDNVLHNNIKDTVAASLRTYKTIQQTARALYDGYGSANDVLNEAELPKYIKRLQKLTVKMYSGDVEAAKSSKIYKAAARDLKKLKTPGLRAAYSDVAEAAAADKAGALKKARKMTELGASRDEIDAMLAAERERAVQKALDVATQEKTRYYAERIARTESARAYYEGQITADANDDDVFGYEWKMSSAHVHSQTDCECQEYAELDVGYGKGIFPKDDVPQLPAHPNCMCHLRKVYAWEVKKTNGNGRLPKQEKETNRVEEATKAVQQ